MCSDLFLSVFIHANSEYFNSFWTRIFIFPSLRGRQPRPQGFSLKKWTHPFFEGKALGTRLRGRRLEVVGARNNERARGRHALARLFFLGPATQAEFLDNGVMMSPKAGRNIISLHVSVSLLLFFKTYPDASKCSTDLPFSWTDTPFHHLSPMRTSGAASKWGWW